MGIRQAGEGSVMVWAMFYMQTLGPVFHEDVTLTRTTYLSIVTDHTHPIMETVLPDGCCHFQQDNAQNKEHNNKFEVLTRPPNSPDLYPIEHLWDALDKQVQSMEAPPHNVQDLKDLLLTS